MNLKLEKLKAFGEQDLPCGLTWHNLENSSEKNKSVFIGTLEISKIFCDKDGKYWVSNISCSKFKSLEHAIKGIKRRLNKR